MYATSHVLERRVPRYPDAIEAGDVTFARARLPPVAANDNHAATGPRIIGLIGYGGAGKTTVANILREEHGFKGPHIGAPLKNMLRSLLQDFGVRPSMIESYIGGEKKRDLIPELGRTSTEVQQFLGTEFGREFCTPNLWLDCWLAKADTIIAAGGRVVQESVRFENEAAAIRARGGIIVEVNRPGVGPLPGGHKSEVLPCSPDATLYNNETVDDLRWRVRCII
jgi:hypothetical protein